MTSTEVEERSRLERLLAQLKPRARERLLEARAVMVLEVRGTAAARRILKRLASGLPEAVLTREATSALKRLDKRSSVDRR